MRLITFAILLMLVSCSAPKPGPDTTSLSDSLIELINHAPGTVGVAFVSDTDTVIINNGVRYPMMSVFKLHQALAVGRKLANTNAGLDTVLHINPVELDKDTWSPMLKKYSGDTPFDITAAELARYAVTSSDNNASNLLFTHIVSPSETDAFIRSIASDTTFRITYSEAEMKKDHDKSYSNYTSPLAAARLIHQTFTDNTLPTLFQDSIRSWLSEVTTGQDRLGVVLEENDSIFFGHKTGSGYRNNTGDLIAHNDVGYFRLPDGQSYALAVLIRDFHGSEQEASAVIAAISRLVYNHVRAPKSDVIVDLNIK